MRYKRRGLCSAKQAGSDAQHSASGGKKSLGRLGGRMYGGEQEAWAFTVPARSEDTAIASGCPAMGTIHFNPVLDGQRRISKQLLLSDAYTHHAWRLVPTVAAAVPCGS